MNNVTKLEHETNVHGVPARAFNVVTADNGRILNQVIKASKYYTENGRAYRITVSLRFDDQCNNGHETFAITADIRENGREYMGGCCHDEIATHFPALAPLIKWHLTSTDGPMHYVANTLYHALEHGPDRAWVYYIGASDPIGIEGPKERLIGYVKADQARQAEGASGYRVVWDEKTAKAANFNHARATAVWPDATIEQLRDKAALEARLPALLAEFRGAMTACGFVWPLHVQSIDE